MLLAVVDQLGKKVDEIIVKVEPDRHVSRFSIAKGLNIRKQKGLKEVGHKRKVDV